MSLKSSTSKDSIARDRSDSSDSKRTIKKERGGILGKLFGSNNSLKGSKSNIKEETEDEIVQLRHKKDYLSSSSYAHLNLSGVNLTQQSQSPSTSSSSLSTSPTQAKLADSSSSSRTTTTVDTSSYLSTSMAKNMYSLSSRNLEESMEIQGYDLHAEADELYSGKAARLAKKVITDPIFDYGASDYDLSSKKTKGTVEEDELRSSTGSNLSVKSNNSLDYDGPAVSYRDWDLEFQKLLQQKDELAKFQKLSNLGRDFIYTAKTYGRIIINELCLPYEHKSVKPKEVGGIAGGTKYIAQGILFKLVVDERKLYHGDHWAMKAASAELKGVMSYGNCKIPNLVTPLMALIDYRGFRLIAISLVNIDKTSLVYGSSDAGKTVAADDPVVNAKMKEAALKLNLKGHYVKDKLLYSAVDVEVHRHKELKDIYYVIDCARVMPPEAPSKTARIGSHLYNLLRPELVKSNQVPLSSDAFARFGKQDPNHKIHNKEVRDATSRLFDDVIPHFAKTLDNLNPKVLTNWLSTEKLHRAGINLRHLGLVRCKTVNPTAKTVLLTEIVARVLKNIIRKMFRDKLRDIQTPSEQPYYSLLLTFMNQNVLGNDCDFWTDTLKSHMIDQYQQSLSSEEIKHSFDIRSGIDWKRLINRFQDLTNIKFTKQANANLARYLPGSSFLLFEPDIKKIGVSVSHLSVIYHAEAKMLLLKAAMYENFERGETDWLWKLADNAFEAAIASSTDSQLTLCEWGSMLFKHSRKGSTGISNLSRSDQNLLIRAAEKYQIAHAISPLQDPNVLVEWVQVLCTLGWYHRSESDNEIYLQPLKASYDYEKISTVNGSVGERFYARGAYLLEIVIKQYLRDKELFKRDQLKVKYKTLLSFIKEITKEQQQSLGMFLHLLIRSETIKTFICSKFKKIDRLDLSNCGSHMRDAAIIESLKLSNFKKLIFQRCENVDDRLFLDISKYQLFVEHIDVSYCVRVLGGDHLSNLLNICGKLKSLTLVGCKIKEEELFQLAVKSKKKLDRMEISNSNVYNRCSTEGLKFVVCTQPQISFDLKSLIVSEEDVIINEQDITISDSDNNNLAFGKYQQKDVVIKTLLKKEDIIYTTEEQAKSVITRLFKIRDTKFIPILGMYLDKNAVKIVVERQRGVLLNTYLKETKDISFWMRMRIAYEIASACKWLFASKDFIIPKLKTTNVFLLLSENSSVKIGGIYSSDAVYKNLEISDRFLAERNTILEFASVLLDIFTPISHSSSGKIHIDPNEQKQYEDVKKLITDCKREDSRSRPSFDDLLNKFEDILFGTKSSHTNNRLLWESINKNWKVTWEVLWRQLMVIGSANFGGSKHRTYEGVLKKLLSSPDEDLLERFYKILYWFGPFEDVQHIIDKIIPLCKEPWFFGFVEESASFLSDCDKSTYFLVRFSQKQWGSYVVVINRPNNRIRSKVTQVRILPDKDNKLLIDDNHMKERKFATLADAIDYLRDKKLIESPCPGSPFQAFFNDSENKNDNANSEETYQLVSEFENYSFNIFNAEAMRQT